MQAFRRSYEGDVQSFVPDTVILPRMPSQPSQRIGTTSSHGSSTLSVGHVERIHLSISLLSVDRAFEVQETKATGLLAPGESSFATCRTNMQSIRFDPRLILLGTRNEDAFESGNVLNCDERLPLWLIMRLQGDRSVISMVNHQPSLILSNDFP